MIKKATYNDIKNLQTLCIQVWMHTYAQDGINSKISDFVLDTFTFDYFQNKIDDKNFEICIYTIEENLVACIIIDKSAKYKNKLNGFEISTLYVQEHFQGQGIGKKLLLEIAKEYGDTFWLSTWVHNYNAIKFYKKIGFIDIGKRFFRLDGEKHENRVLSMKNMLSIKE